MRVLIAEDDPVQRHLLTLSLRAWGFEPELAEDGETARLRMLDPAGPSLIILDWMMPGMDGIEACRQVRAASPDRPLYIILLTARGHVDDVVEGLKAGADDYVQKPFHAEELRARARNGQRVLGLQQSLAARVVELEGALARVRELQGLLPMCAYCKKIRSDQNYWKEVEAYFAEHVGVRFSHGICPHCYDEVLAREESPDG
jgi:sigma-B regulation protein RsbU (phosphoserine phosphatase)